MKAVIKIILLSLCFNLGLSAQDRYMVFFTDKAGTDFSLNNPIEYLSQRAIDRRTRQGIALSENDVPVNQRYINSIKDLGAEVYFSTKWMNGVLVQMDADLIPAINELPFVNKIEYVAPGAILSENVDGDAYNGSMAEDVSASAFQNEMLDIDIMHEEGFRGEGMLVGVFDGGFSNISGLSPLAHLFAANKILLTKDFVINRNNVENQESHGTRVLSILASNAEGEFVGAAPAADYMLFVTEAAGEFRVEEYNWLFAAEMADSAGVDVVNTSLGYSNFDDDNMDYTYQDMDGQTTVITKAANLAASKGILLVNSAGNEGNNSWNFITAPADSDSVLAIGAINSAFSRATFSSFGPSADGRVKPDLSALGQGTAVVTASGNIANQNGTSFSSPIVAGLVTGFWQAFPALTNFQVMQIMKESASQFNSPDNDLGYGIPSFVRAVELARNLESPIESGVVVYPNPITDDSFTLALEQSYFGKEVVLTLVDRNGKSLSVTKIFPTQFKNRFEINFENGIAGLYILNIQTSDQQTMKKLIKY
jgi:subtilisin family serine protease